MTNRLVQAIILVEDLAEGRRRMEALGFAVADGGRHPGRGTANLIVPLGEQYLELLAVIDPDEARASPDGRAVLDALHQRGPGLARWSIEPDDIASVSARLGLPIDGRQRRRPDGALITWRAVGVNEAWVAPWRCAFMAWDEPSLHPARLADPHPNRARGVVRLDVSAPDVDVAADWVGGDVPLEVVLKAGSETGPRALTVATPAGTLLVE